jgi:scyllo-inositol 2-dehydrogenase (NADP+)
MTPIKTALLSYGMSGEIFHAPLLHAHPGFTLTSVLQRRSTSARSRYPEVKIVTDIDELISDESIELVVVNTPNETHFDFASSFLKAGKNVIVEKPFSVTAVEADELVSIGKKSGKLLSVFQNRRWDGDFLTVRKVIDGGLVGTIVEFELHYDRFRNYIEANTWKEESGPGTGILYNLGSHMLDQVVVLFGYPLRVDARVGIQRPGGKVDDFYDIRLEYSGFHVIVKSSYLVREQGPRYVIHGTEGSYVKYGIDPQEQALKEGKVPGGAGWGTEPRAQWGKLNSNIGGLHVEGLLETIPGNYLSYYENIYQAIRNSAKLEVTPDQPAQVIRMIEACYRSNSLKSSVAL